MPNRLVTGLTMSDVGDGPAVVLVHGVGIGAWAFDEVAAALSADHRVLVPHRRGYGPDDAEGGPGSVSASVAEQVDDLLELLGVLGLWQATLVGVSGGATIVLALAMAAPGIVRAAVVHEPVFGPLAPELHGVLRDAAARLASADPGPDGVRDFLAGLVGDERWAALPAPRLQAILRRPDVVRAEVPAFLAFAPSSDDLARLRDVTLVATVGSCSPEYRQLAAAVLAREAGARMEVIDGARHLPQLEAPQAFEKVIRGAVGAGDRS